VLRLEQHRRDRGGRPRVSASVPKKAATEDHPFMTIPAPVVRKEW